MGIEDVIRRIEAEAEEESKGILDDAKARSKRIREEERAKVETDLRELKRSLEREKANLVNIYLSEGRRKARQAVLAAKEHLIWEAMAGIRERFRKMDGGDLKALYGRQLETLRKALGPDMNIFAVRGLDADVLRSLGASVEGVIEGDDPLPEAISRMRSRSLIGGFMARSGDGRMTMDMTFEGLLERNRETIRSRISEVLFSE